MSRRKLKEFLPEAGQHKIYGDESVAIEDLTLDSREVRPGWLFIAKKGTGQDGHDFIPMAIEKGAKAVLLERIPEKPDSGITWIEVKSVSSVIAEMAEKFFDKPSQHLSVIGITGTNGKTSTAYMIYQILNRLDHKCGLISTIDIRVGKEVIPSKLTTPDVISVNRLLAKMVDDRCEAVVMEASSHALDQGRLQGIRFETAVFTNISHDHLDYHGDMKAYISAKKLLFDYLDHKATAIINWDDKRGEVMVQNSKAKKVTYSLHRMADHRLRLLSMDLNGMHLEKDGTQFMTMLIGDFNAYNLLAAIAVCMELGFEADEVLEMASIVTPAAGRFELLRNSEGQTVAVVDYAHTPDALEKILTSVNALKRQTQKVITVVGCGGDRDKAKRPKMAKIAARFSDQLIITSDNPRSEDPARIIEEMLDGLDEQSMSKTIAIEDREQAIKTACALRQNTDVVVVAGKGHEDYQEVAGIRHHFDDKQKLKVYLKDL